MLRKVVCSVGAALLWLLTAWYAVDGVMGAVMAGSGFSESGAHAVGALLSLGLALAASWCAWRVWKLRQPRIES